MKDGRIANQGTFEEVRHALPLASESECNTSGTESQSDVDQQELRKQVRIKKRRGMETKTAVVLGKKVKISINSEK